MVLLYLSLLAFFACCSAVTHDARSSTHTLKHSAHENPFSSVTNHTCTPDQLSILSCSPQSIDSDTCCTESPGGLLLLTQLYNWNPGLGPRDSWTLHGLWPDFCNGSYPASCDVTRNYTGIAGFLEKSGEGRLLRWMEKFWRNDPVITTTNGTDEDLWEHEWAKHGTCMSTLRPTCFSTNLNNTTATKPDLLSFLHATVKLNLQLPTFSYLSACGIVPTNATTYPLASIESCLTNAFDGYLPHIGCVNGYLAEVWYYHHLAGRIESGRYVPTNTTYKSTCPEAVRYPPKLRKG